MDVQIRGLGFPVKTVRGLPEFDSLDFQTKLLVDALWKRKDLPASKLLILNPGQGHVSVALWQLYTPQEMVLVNRDLLSLQNSKRNLVANGCPDDRIKTRHMVGLREQDEQPMDLMIWIVGDSTGQKTLGWLLDQAAESMTPEGRLLITGKSTPITRLVSLIKKTKILSSG